VTKLDGTFDERVGGILERRDAVLRDEFTGITKDQLAGFEDRLPQLVAAQVQPVTEATIRRIATETVDARLRVP
ncbi:MAG TPA: hypothetical protein VLB47_11315, partial [Solirubrobacteraceae bacterium]|nr:hypothetical protein [Solirubrobacteraceae bacterium]